MQNSKTIRAVHRGAEITISVYSIQKRLKRAGHSFGLDDELSPTAANLLNDWYNGGEAKEDKQPSPPDSIKPTPPISKPIIKEEVKPILPKKPVDQANAGEETPVFPAEKAADRVKIEEKTVKAKAFDWDLVREVVPALSLPMLGLAASYGVYFFAVQFLPTFIAVVEAASFELIYIGLAMIKVNKDQEKFARYVSQGAVGVSILYNSIAYAIHLRPDLLLDLDLVMMWILSVVHGAPLAILAYLVSDLLFHSK